MNNVHRKTLINLIDIFKITFKITRFRILLQFQKMKCTIEKKKRNRNKKPNKSYGTSQQDRIHTKGKSSCSEYTKYSSIQKNYFFFTV